MLIVIIISNMAITMLTGDDKFYLMSKDRLQNVFNSLRGVKQFLNDHLKTVGDDIRDFSSDSFLYNTFEADNGTIYKESNEMANIFSKFNPKYELRDVELGLDIYFWLDGHNDGIKRFVTTYNDMSENSGDFLENLLCNANLEDILYSQDPIFQLIICKEYFNNFYYSDKRIIDGEYNWQLYILTGGECKDERTYKSFLEAITIYNKHEYDLGIDPEEQSYPDAVREIKEFMRNYDCEEIKTKYGTIQLSSGGHLI